MLLLKKGHPALWNGEAGGETVRIPISENGRVMAFMRVKDDDRIAFIANLSAVPSELFIDDERFRGMFSDVLTGQTVSTVMYFGISGPQCPIENGSFPRPGATLWPFDASLLVAACDRRPVQSDPVKIVRDLVKPPDRSNLAPDRIREENLWDRYYLAAFRNQPGFMRVLDERCRPTDA